MCLGNLWTAKTQITLYILRTVCLHHSLSAYSILDTVDYIHVYSLANAVIRLYGLVAELNLYCIYVSRRHINVLRALLVLYLLIVF